MGKATGCPLAQPCLGDPPGYGRHTRPGSLRALVKSPGLLEVYLGRGWEPLQRSHHSVLHPQVSVYQRCLLRAFHESTQQSPGE